MMSITRFIETELKLQVNKGKSKVSRPNQSTLLGFSFHKNKSEWLIRIAKKSVLRMREKIKTHLKRTNPSSLSTKFSMETSTDKNLKSKTTWNKCPKSLRMGQYK